MLLFKDDDAVVYYHLIVACLLKLAFIAWNMCAYNLKSYTTY